MDFSFNNSVNKIFYFSLICNYINSTVFYSILIFIYFMDIDDFFFDSSLLIILLIDFTISLISNGPKSMVSFFQKLINLPLVCNMPLILPFHIGNSLATSLYFYMLKVLRQVLPCPPLILLLPRFFR